MQNSCNFSWLRTPSESKNNVPKKGHHTQPHMKETKRKHDHFHCDAKTFLINLLFLEVYALAVLVCSNLETKFSDSSVRCYKFHSFKILRYFFVQFDVSNNSTKVQKTVVKILQNCFLFLKKRSLTVAWIYSYCI